MTLRKKTALIVSITLFSLLVILYFILLATGRDGTHIFLLSSLVIGLILGLTILILLERQVMSRLTGLINNVGTVGKSGDLSRRVQQTGDDELSLLSAEINRMLEALEKSGKDLRDSEEMFRAISATANDTIILMDDHGNIAFWNKAAEMAFGYSAQEIMGKNLHDLLVPLKYLAEFKTGFEHFMLTGQGRIIGKRYEVTALRKNGEEFPVELSVSAVNLQGKWNAIGIVRDITRRKQVEADLRALSLRDELTGLYNRRGFLTLAEQQLKVANRVRKVMLLMFADLDDMKYINDVFGHQEGDRALIGIGQILKKTFRESDIVARFGGDEFVVLSLETLDSGTEILANRLREHLDYYNRYENRPYELSVSIGISRYDPENPVDLHDLIVNADKMMYEQKNTRKREKGKNI
jgi:diguanylate cyclase (GGDEF)-like protein/PAS domain S-box-containing protein